MPLVSWQQYDEEHRLSEVLTDAARACVAARVQQPSEYLATYFATVTRGDAVDALTCCPVLTQRGAGYAVRVRLCTLAEGEAHALYDDEVDDAVPRHSSNSNSCNVYKDSTDDCGAGEVSAVHRTSAAVCAYVQQHVVPALLRVGVCEQQRWDSTLAQAWHDNVTAATTAATSPPQPRVPLALCFALSLAASRAAARARRVSLHHYYRALYLQCGDDGDDDNSSHGKAQTHTTRRDGGKAMTTGAPGAHATLSYAPPQVLLPFFGRAFATSASAYNATTTTAAAAAGAAATGGGEGSSGGSSGAANSAAAVYATPPGTVCVHTIFLVPMAHASSSSSSSTAATTTTMVTTAAATASKGRQRASATATHRASVASVTRDGDGDARSTNHTAAGANNNNNNKSSQGNGTDHARKSNSNSSGDKDDGSSSSHGTCALAGGLTADTLSRLLTAYRLFATRHPECAVRGDGAFVYDALENISDAVQVCSEVLREAGLALGKDVLLGVRIDCPVVTVTMAAAATATAAAMRATPEQATAAGAHTTAGKASKAANGGKASRTASSAASQQQQQQQQQASNNSNSNSGSRTTTLYALFPGDPDITGAQLTEYVKQQMAASEGVFAFVENTHAAQHGRVTHSSERAEHADSGSNGKDDNDDEEEDEDEDDAFSVRRLQRAIGDRVVVSHRVRRHGDELTADNDDDNDDHDKATTASNATVACVQRGVRRGLAMHFTVDPVRVGSVSALVALARHVSAHGGGLGLSCAHTGRDACALVELALGVGAHFVDVGGLNAPSACEALSHLVSVLEQLQSTHALVPRDVLRVRRVRARRAGGAAAAAAAAAVVDGDSGVPHEVGGGDDADDDADDAAAAAAVPEIRRRGDKKRKKPSKH